MGIWKKGRGKLVGEGDDGGRGEDGGGGRSWWGRGRLVGEGILSESKPVNNGVTHWSIGKSTQKLS